MKNNIGWDFAVFIFGFATFGVGNYFFKVDNDVYKQPIVECRPAESLVVTKKHKFHYNDEIIAVDGFYKGLTGRIYTYSNYNDEYGILPDDNLLQNFYAKETEIKLKNKEDQLIDSFSKFTNEELMGIVVRKSQEVIGLSGVAMEKAKRQDAEDANKELKRRGIYIRGINGVKVE